MTCRPPGQALIKLIEAAAYALDVSEHSVSVVRLDVLPLDEVHELARVVAGWLRNAGFIEPNTRLDAMWQPSLWMPGREWRTAVEAVRWLDAFEKTANNGVDVERERSAHHPVENLEVAACGLCGSVLPDEVYFETLEIWLDKGEPEIECSRCQSRALIGDWPAEFGFAVGSPAVRFNNWPSLRGSFVNELRRQLGGRTFVVKAHT